MPWNAADVDRFKKGLSPAKKRQWVSVANSTLARCKRDGGSNCEAQAIRAANGTVREAEELMKPTLIERAIAALQGRQTDPRELLEAELSHGDIQKALHKALKEGKPSGVYCYINDVYDAWFVYTEEGNGTYRAWAQRYSIDEDTSQVTLTDSPWEVVQQNEWVALANATEAERNLAPPLPTYSSEIEQPVVESEQAVEDQLVDEGEELDLPEGAEPLIEAAVPLIEKSIRKDKSFPVKLISPGWGSSGYYSKALLEQAAKAGKFQSGLKMFWNHPTSDEAAKRPERDLRDLAAKTITKGVFKENGPDGPGVYADAKAYSHYAPHIEELAEDIGLSIRGFGVTKPGEAEGQKGALVEDIAAVQSVDFVTQAGRGGRVLQLMEAARAHATAAVEPLKEDAVMGDKIEESAALTEAQTEAREAKARADRYAERLILREAGDVVRTALAESKLPDITTKRLSEQLVANPPTTEKDGETVLDEAKFKEQIGGVIEATKAEIAALTGQGNVSTLGESATDDGAAPSGEKAQESLVEAFQNMGYSESAAKAAAAGRIQ